LPPYDSAGDTLGEPVSQGKGKGSPTGTCHCPGGVCGEGELINNSGVCVALPLPPTHLVKRQKERDRESLCTHPLKNDKCGGG